MYLNPADATFSGRHSTKGGYDTQNARASFHYIARAGPDRQSEPAPNRKHIRRSVNGTLIITRMPRPMQQQITGG